MTQPTEAHRRKAEELWSEHQGSSSLFRGEITPNLIPAIAQALAEVEEEGKQRVRTFATDLLHANQRIAELNEARVADGLRIGELIDLLALARALLIEQMGEAHYKLAATQDVRIQRIEEAHARARASEAVESGSQENGTPNPLELDAIPVPLFQQPDNEGKT